MWFSRSIGQGKVIYSPERAGFTYFNTNDKDILKKFTEAAQNSGPQIITNAPQAVVIDIRKATDGSLLLFIANLNGLGIGPFDKFNPKDAHFSVFLLVDEKTPKQVILSSPTKGVKNIQVPFKLENNRIKFEVKVHASILSIIKFG